MAKSKKSTKNPGKGKKSLDQAADHLATSMLLSVAADKGRGRAKAKKPAKDPATPAAPEQKPSAFLDDPRLPAVGTVIERVYKGETYRVERTATDFRYQGKSYRSLSAIASEILGGASVNGFLWFGLTPRAGKPAKVKPASSAPKDPDANDLATPAGQRRAQEEALTPKRRKAATHKRKVDTSTADAPAGDDVGQDAPSAE